MNPYKQIQSQSLAVAVLIVYAVSHLAHINADLWNDEIYTLKNFVFVPISQTVSDYHVPNNHVLFNLINNIYVRLSGIDSLHDLMDNPFVLRTLYLLYAIITAVYLYLIGRKFFSSTTGVLAVILLATNLPWYNFALQIRGYGLSAMLLSMFIYYALACLTTRSIKNLISVLLLSAALLYTLPSNLYPVISATGVVAIYGLVQFFSKSGHTLGQLLRLPAFRIVLATVAGIGLAIALYFPILDDILSNPYLQPGKPFDFGMLRYYALNIPSAYISGRWMLLLLSIPGLLLLFRDKDNNRLAFSVLIITGILPPLIAYMRGDLAPLRTYTVLLPVVSLVAAAAIDQCWSKIDRRGRFIIPFLIIVLLYSGHIFDRERQKQDTHLLNDIEHNMRTQNLQYQFYSGRYQPLKDIREFKRDLYSNTILPVAIVDCEPHGVPNYLEKFDIPYLPDGSLDSLMTVNDSIWVITNHPDKVMHFPGWSAESKNKELTYHNVMLLHRIDDEEH